MTMQIKRLTTFTVGVQEYRIKAIIMYSHGCQRICFEHCAFILDQVFHYVELIRIRESLYNRRHVKSSVLRNLLTNALFPVHQNKSSGLTKRRPLAAFNTVRILIRASRATIFNANIASTRGHVEHQQFVSFVKEMPDKLCVIIRLFHVVGFAIILKVSPVFFVVRFWNNFATIFKITSIL